MNTHNATLITFVVYIFAMLAIGFIAWRSTKNFSDYILGRVVTRYSTAYILF